MKDFYHRQLRKLLKLLARMVIAKFQPMIVGVTGTVGKTSAKEAIYQVLASQKKVRKNFENLNNRFGLPLTIFGDYTHSGNIFFWIAVICRVLARLVAPKSWSHYPEVIILEYAADRPGDIGYLIGVARPSISVITAVGDIPVHVEFYENADAVAREKSSLVESLPGTGTAVLNADDDRVAAMRSKTNAKVITFGFSQNAQVRIMNLQTNVDVNKNNGLSWPTGISFELHYNGAATPIRLTGTAGPIRAYAAAAAACVGLSFNISIEDAAKALGLFRPLSSRMSFLEGKGNTLIIDDSYNASPLSMSSAIGTIKELPSSRKVAILGDMRELGKFSEQAHRQIGKLAAEVFNVIVTVGAESKLIEEEAKKIAPNKVYYSFPDVNSALEPITRIVKEGDLVLVKASHTIGLQKVVAALRAA